MRLLFASIFVALLGAIQALATASPATVFTLSVTVRPADRLLSVSGLVVVPAQKTERSKLLFQLADQVKNLQMQVVSPATAAGALHPTMVSDNGTGSGNWSADLANPVPAGVPITLKVSYEGGSKTAFVFHIGPEGSYACGTNTAWYPEFGPASTSGKFSVEGDALAVGSVTYQIPSDLQLVANGRGSDPNVTGAIKTEKFVTEKPSALAFVVDRFRVVHGAGRVPVSLYLKSDLGDDQVFATGIQRVVDLLSTIYGPFPFPEFSLVEVSDEAVVDAGFGGAGCAGFMISTTSFLDQGFNEAFFGHEIGHQWWGNLVTHGVEKEGDDILDEAMAQYGSLYCVEHMLGFAAAKRYRTIGFPGYVSTQCGYNYLGMHKAGFDHVLENLNAADPISHELACEKGFLVFDQLRRELGDETFHRGLKTVTRDYAFRSITLGEFKNEIERVAHRDLGWFWDQWFKRLGAPSLSARWKQDGRWVEGEVRQTAPYYRLRVPIAVRSDSGTVSMLQVDLSGPSAIFRQRVEGTVAGVDIDPDFTILHYSPELEERATAMLPTTKVEWAGLSGKPTADLIDSELTGLAGPDRFGVGFRLHYYRARGLYREKSYAEAAQEIDLALDCPTRTEELLPLCYQLMMYDSAALKDLSRAAWAAKAAIVCEKELGQNTSISKSAEAWLKKKTTG